MTPILLTMEAFGPYLQKTTIDFTKLGEESLFLITGSTGGGKTSILDGMCFALYCRATGGRRGWAEMRCDSAPDETPTNVELVFSLGKEKYRFQRSQKVHYVRGSGRRELREEHTCWKEQDGQWELWESGSESQIRRCAERLLGLTAEQFSQVIVLPQGDFLRLLRANSREKGEMLRTLFAMTEWVKIQDALRERTKKLEQQVGNADARRDALLRQEQVETPEALSQKVEELETQKKTWGQQAKAQQEQEAKVGELLTRRRELTLARTRLQKEQENVKQQTARHQEMERRTAQQREAMKELPNLREQASQAAKQAARLEGELREAQQLKEAGEKLSQTQKEIQSVGAKAEKAAAAEKDCRERLARGQEFMQQIQAAAEALPALQEEESRLQRGLEAYGEVEKAQEQVQRRKKTVEEHKARLAGDVVTARELSAGLARQEALLRADQASWLAEGLREGEPCPVCGSVHHPAPAQCQEAAMTKEELELLRTREEKARNTVSAGEGRLRALQEEVAQWEKELSSRGEQAAAFGSRESLVQAQTELSQKLQAARTAAQKRVAAQKRLDDLNRELETAHTNGEAALRQREALLARETEQRTRQEELLAHWQGNPPQPEQLLQEKKQAEEQSLSLSQKANQMEKEWSLLQNQAGAAAAALQEAQKRAEEAKADCSRREEGWQGEIPGEEALSLQYQQEKEKLDGINRALGQLSQQFTAGKTALRQLAELDKEFGQLQITYQQTARLYRLLSGSNPMRIPLDKYVLSIMLEEILACANRYFARFSRERYALQRSRERASNNAYGGLDLEVLDGMTGHQRSVDTLSGGEQFLASLSLALGLSEVVQSQSGCVRLESLFIDEGFGSLDQETLDTAMKALSLLHQGGRNIGIISHVSELRNRIPAHIEVSRLPDGTAKATVTDGR